MKFSSGSRVTNSRNTDRPPTPESKTPMGASLTEVAIGLQIDWNDGAVRPGKPQVTLPGDSSDHGQWNIQARRNTLEFRGRNAGAQFVVVTAGGLQLQSFLHVGELREFDRLRKVIRADVRADAAR